jgi:hypothetical protein
MIRALTQVVLLHPCYRVNILLFVGSCQKLLLINEVEWVALCSRIYIGGARACWPWVIRIKYTLPIYFEFHISLLAAAFQQENELLAHLIVRPCSGCVNFFVICWCVSIIMTTCHCCFTSFESVDMEQHTWWSNKWRSTMTFPNWAFIRSTDHIFLTYASSAFIRVGSLPRGINFLRLQNWHSRMLIELLTLIGILQEVQYSSISRRSGYYIYIYMCVSRIIITFFSTAVPLV